VHTPHSPKPTISMNPLWVSFAMKRGCLSTRHPTAVAISTMHHPPIEPGTSRFGGSGCGHCTWYHIWPLSYDVHKLEYDPANTTSPSGEAAIDSIRPIGERLMSFNSGDATGPTSTIGATPHLRRVMLLSLCATNFRRPTITANATHMKNTSS